MAIPDDLRRFAADMRAGRSPRPSDADQIERAAVNLTLLWSVMLQTMADKSRGDGANA